jgi:hypothetical protein
VNPDFYLYWKDSNGNEQVFNATIIKEKQIKKAQVISFYKSFFLVNGNYSSYPVDKKITVKLKFFLDGVKAEIVILNDSALTTIL